MDEGTKQVTREYTGESRFRPIYLLIAAIVIVAIGVVIGWLIKRNQDRKTYAAYDVVKTKQLPFTTVNGILPIRNGVLRYARDGAEAVNQDGESLWNVSYNMANPVADTCGKFAAIGDAGGVSMYIMDGTGSFHNVTTDHAIVRVAVAANGETAVLMDDGKDDYISIYHADGTRVVDMNTVTTVNGFPLDLAISEDGTKLVVSFAYFEDDAIRSRLVFYNFGGVGRSYYDGMVGKAESVKTDYPDNLYADVEFVTNDRVAVFGDRGLLVYEMEEIPNLEPKQITYTGTLRRFTFSSQYIGLLTEKRDGGRIQYAVTLYDTNGNQTETRTMDSYYSGFRIDGKDVILYSDTALYIYRVKGNDKYKAAVTRAVSYCFGTDESNGFVLISDNQFNRIRLIGGD
ncbi:MAG: hypothetical protein J6Y67_06060 [Lachnospiraceae bacterium]|nr:hypothetical protein [Lachnospiraceae bacterium]